MGARSRPAEEYIYRRTTRVVRVNRSKRANHFGTAVEKRMAEKRRFELERGELARREIRKSDASRDQINDARARRRPARELESLPRKYHEKLRRHDGWYCFVVYRAHGRSGCTILRDKMVRSSDLPLLRWHGGGDHRGTEQTEIPIDTIF